MIDTAQTFGRRLARARQALGLTQRDLAPPEIVMPWLMNLLPEGEPLGAMTRAVGVAPEDVLGLIAQTGRDLAGAFAIGRPRPQESPGFTPIGAEHDLERIIEELPARPLLVGEEGVSISLPGAQDKLPMSSWPRSTI